MSALSTGVYFIANRVVDPNGALALYFNGAGNTVTVTNSGISNNTFWQYDASSQIIAPFTDPTLSAIWDGNGNLVPVPDTSIQWIIENTNGLFTVQDKNQLDYWYLAEATDGEGVTSSSTGSGTGTEKWEFIPVQVNDLP